MNKRKKLFITALMGIFSVAAISGMAACSGGGSNGVDGADGADGTNGKSAYELYVETYGYTGTEAQWLLDLANGTLATATPDEYTVTFNSEGAGDIASQTVTNGGKVTEPETPTLAGHTFLGWYVGEEKWSFIGYSVTENITLTAKWAVTNTDITYTLNTETETYEVTAYSGTDEVIDILPTVDGIAVTGIADNVFKSNTHIKSVTIHEGLTSIGASAFNSCSNLAEITLPLSLTNIGSTAFADSAIENVYYAGTATQWASITFGSGSSSPMFNGAALYLNGDTTAVTSITLESGLTAINSSAFYGCTSLTSITIPATVTSIGGYTFKECVNLEKVEFSGESQLTSIGTEAFYNCTSLASYDIPDGVTTIGTYAFYQCTSLTSIVIPDGLETIESRTFSGCTSLTSVTIPLSVTKFGSSAFMACTSITNVYYAGTASQWAGEKITFDGNSYSNPLNYGAALYLEGNTTTAATDITISGVSAVGYAAFAGCTSITSVTLSSSITTIPRAAFYNCTSLTSITIPSTVTAIYQTAFTNAPITNVYYGGSASDWASIAFDSTNTANPLSNGATLYLNGSTTTAATEITISGITEISAYAFRGCTSIISVTLGNDVTTIGESAFQNCYALRSMTLGSGVTTIGSNAFGSCWRMTEVNNYSSLSLTAGGSGNGSITFYTIVPVHTSTSNSRGSFVTEGDYVFYAYTSGDTTTYYLAYYIGTDTDITLPSKIYEQTYTINTYALAKNTTITSIVIPDTVTELSTGALYGCSSMTYIVIGSGVTSIAASNSTGMSNLTTIYYKGTSEDKANLTIDSNSSYIINATWYYYSEEQPTDTEGNYWHYVEGVPTVWVVESADGGTTE